MPIFIKKILLLVLCLLFFLKNFGQSVRIENIVKLKNKLENAQGYQKATILNQLTHEWVQYKLDSAIKYSKIAKDFITQHHLKKSYAALYLNLYEISIYTNDVEQSLTYLSKAKSYFYEKGDSLNYLLLLCRISELLISNQKNNAASQALKEIDLANKTYNFIEVNAYKTFL